MSRPEIALIVARAQNGAIGKENTLPWRLRDDLQQFKRLTLGCPVIMGRKTWESLGRPLPKRRNLVISRQPAYCAEGAETFTSLEEALASCASDERVFIIGGAQVYAQALALADVLWISEVATKIEGDAYFPHFEATRFREVSRTPFKANEHNQYDFDVVEYRRQTQGSD